MAEKQRPDESVRLYNRAKILESKDMPEGHYSKRVQALADQGLYVDVLREQVTYIPLNP